MARTREGQALRLERPIRSESVQLVDAGLVAGVGGCERVAMRVALGAAAFVTVSVPACVEAARPWRGPIVDVETQEPLKWVVALAYWSVRPAVTRRSHSPMD